MAERPAEIGGGELNVVLTLTNPDGTVDVLTVHKVVMDPFDDEHGAWLTVENDYGDDIDDGFMRRKNTLKAPIKTMEVRFRGRLEQADPEKDELYRMVRTPPPAKEDNDG